MVKYILYGIAGISWVVALVWFTFEPGFEQLLAVLAGLSALIGAFWLPQKRDNDSAGGGTQGTATTQGNNTGQQAGVNQGTMTQNNQTINNNAPNRGAQGNFYGDTNITHGEVNAPGTDFSGSQNTTISGVTVNRKRGRDEAGDE